MSSWFLVLLVTLDCRGKREGREASRRLLWVLNLILRRLVLKCLIFHLVHRPGVSLESAINFLSYLVTNREVIHSEFQKQAGPGILAFGITGCYICGYLKDYLSSSSVYRLQNWVPGRSNTYKGYRASYSEYSVYCITQWSRSVKSTVSGTGQPVFKLLVDNSPLNKKK